VLRLEVKRKIEKHCCTNINIIIIEEGFSQKSVNNLRLIDSRNPIFCWVFCYICLLRNNREFTT